MDCAVLSQNQIQQNENQDSFGIRKIVDCKLSQDGRQMYRVKWEPTWEPAENLSSCQKLIDEFWSYVNKAKSNQEVAHQHRKRLKLDSSNGVNNINIDEFNQYKLHEDNKAEIQRLINKNTSDIGNRMMSPSHMLNLPQNNQQNMMAMPRTPQSVPMSPNIIQQMRPLVSSPQQFNSPQRAKVPLNFGNEMKQESEENKQSLPSSVKYLENFSNPYVKIIVVCKICNREQSFKRSSNWKAHFMTHSDKKPHSCLHCEKSYIRADQLRKHVEKEHSYSNQDIRYKSEWNQ
ncbi:tissue-resident T-cell transcription regulator protein ZNF683 isoform X6 [Hydra vulgaris]|uniref:tissue-resident T-cell transcription regulator protein ZNF683 isoform X6 n=1 Tax=Hydra vulgaris TaxID=6087 RepID=UPI001F5E9F36|nr:tissue-resident T-cell transcription regulator protein ZNF683 isoform X7 [Hydra vulgaris]